MFTKGEIKTIMAKKSKTVFVCQECGYESPKWMGQCICGAWNSMVEEKVVDAPQKRYQEADQRRGKTIQAKKKSALVITSALTRGLAN